jgi:hypothetical protein
MSLASLSFLRGRASAPASSSILFPSRRRASSFARVASVTVLARDAKVLDGAYAALVDSLGLRALRDPAPITSASSSSPSSTSLGGGGLSAAVSLDGRTALELVTVPQVPWAWIDREGRPPQLLRLLSVNIGGGERRGNGGGNGEASSPPVFPSAADVAAAVGGGAGRARVLTFLSSVGLSAFASVPHVGPFVSFGAAGGEEGEEAGSPSSSSSLSSSSSSSTHLSLLEIVLGLGEGKGFSDGQAAMERAGATRDASLPSVWRLPPGGGGGAGGGGGGAAASSSLSLHLRLLPGRYSALVLAAAPSAAGADARKDWLARVAGRSSSAKGAAAHDAVVVVEGYGERRGTAGSGQAAVRLPQLQGLDIRVAASPSARPLPCFNEPPESMEDEVDPRLNPPADDPRKQVAMGCPSVVGMEVASTLRMRLGRGQLR